jgi:hypothetical protein
LFLLRPKGRVKTVPADQWAEMERIWVANFPEDAELSAQAPEPPRPPDPSAYDPTTLVVSDDDHDPGAVFADVIDTMTDATAERTDLHPNGISLAIACLTSAAATAESLADVGDPDLDGTEDLIARLSATDEDAAMRVVFALAWYFAFAFQGSALKSVDRDRWLDAMQEALDPTGALRPDDPAHLVDLFESYLAWTPENTHTFPITLCRWVDLHLGLEWDEGGDMASVMLVLPACQAQKDDFLAEARRPEPTLSPVTSVVSRAASSEPTAARPPALRPDEALLASQGGGGLRAAFGWIVDILVGWAVGSVVFGILTGIISASVGMDYESTVAFSQLGTLAGTVVGITHMRRWRRSRSMRQSTR